MVEGKGVGSQTTTPRDSKTEEPRPSSEHLSGSELALMEELRRLHRDNADLVLRYSTAARDVISSGSRIDSLVSQNTDNLLRENRDLVNERRLLRISLARLERDSKKERSELSMSRLELEKTAQQMVIDHQRERNLLSSQLQDLINHLFEVDKRNATELNAKDDEIKALKQKCKDQEIQLSTTNARLQEAINEQLNLHRSFGHRAPLSGDFDGAEDVVGMSDADADYQVLTTINQSNLFDRVWYAARYGKDIPEGIDPLHHYVASGAQKGYAPSPSFDGERYLREYIDVATDNINPLYHYIVYGMTEGRSTWAV